MAHTSSCSETVPSPDLASPLPQPQSPQQARSRLQPVEAEPRTPRPGRALAAFSLLSQHVEPPPREQVFRRVMVKPTCWRPSWTCPPAPARQTVQGAESPCPAPAPSSAARQHPAQERGTHPTGGLCGWPAPNAVVAGGSWVGSFLLPAGGGKSRQGVGYAAGTAEREGQYRRDGPPCARAPREDPWAVSYGKRQVLGQRGRLSNPSR